MKIPVSKLTSWDLDLLFQNSKLIDQHFFPKQVPVLNSYSDSKTTTSSNLQNYHEN